MTSILFFSGGIFLYDMGSMEVAGHGHLLKLPTSTLRVVSKAMNENAGRKPSLN